MYVVNRSDLRGYFGLKRIQYGSFNPVSQMNLIEYRLKFSATHPIEYRLKFSATKLDRDRFLFFITRMYCSHLAQVELS